MIGNQNGVTCFSTEGECHHKEKMEARSPMPGMTERTQGTNLSRTSWKINLNRKKKIHWLLKSLRETVLKASLEIPQTRDTQYLAIFLQGIDLPKHQE